MTTNTINLPFPNSQPINIAPQSINITTSTGTDVPILTTDINNSFLSRQFFTLKPDDFFPEKIKAIKEIVPEKVYLFTFNDNTKIKTIRSEEDPFNLEYMIYLAIAKKMNESQDNTKYTHLAVNKFTNLIVNGWDYADEDPQDLKQFKNDYFIVDLKDYGFNPKVYKIITTKFAEKNGINQWSNTGVFPLEEENKMKQEGKDFYAIANEQHPDWFKD